MVTVDSQPVSAPAATDYQIAIQRGAAALANLQSDWTELWRHSRGATEAQRWLWQTLYWKHVARRSECIVATARDSAGVLQAAGVFERRFETNSFIHVLSFSGEHDADYHQILSRPGVPVSVGQRILAELIEAVGGGVSAIELSNVPKGSWTEEVIRASSSAFGAFANAAQSWESETFAITLPASMDDYWATFSKKTRDRLKGKMRKFEREMAPEFLVATSDIERVLNDIEAVDRARWGAATKFGNAGQREFLRELIRQSVGNGLARVFTLSAQGKCVAYIVGFFSGTSIKIPYLAHAVDLPGNYSVGLINNIMAIEHCIGAGLREYDLTRGSESYKAQLGGELRHNVNWLMYRSAGARVLARFNLKVVAPVVKNRLVRNLFRRTRR